MPPDAPETKLYYDGWQSLPSGMDAGRFPSLIQKDQVAQAVNTTFRGGYPHPRPPYVYRPITFRTTEERDWFENQIYQGSAYYAYVAALNPALHPNNGCIVTSVGGRQWRIDLTSFKAQEITPAKRNGRFQNIVYFCQARQYLIIQDGTSSPIIWDGSNTRRAGYNEVPVATIMAYGQGRIWTLRGDQLIAGDIEGTSEGSVLKFTEFQFLTGGGALNPSYVVGNVNGLQFIPQQDTATGVGTLLVFGETGTTSVFAELPREQWINGIQRVVLINIGGTGHRSPCQINGDIWFRAADGMRSYRQARAQVEYLAQIPLSTELDPFFKLDTPFLLPWGSSAYFDNRLLTTLSPQFRNSRVTFPAIAACDFHILSSFGNERKPCWDGVWTGMNCYELVQCNQNRLFAPGVDSAGRNGLFEILKSDDAQFFDVQDDGNRGAQRSNIIWSIDSGLLAFDAPDGGPMIQKRLAAGKYFLKNIEGPVSVRIQYRKDGEICWTDWVTNDFCANVDLCQMPLDDNGCPTQWQGAAQYRSPVILKQTDIAGLPSDDSPQGAGNSGRAMNIGYEFQTRFTITGFAMIYQAAFECWEGWEPETAICPSDECFTSIVCCDTPYTYTPELGPYYIPDENGLTPQVIAASNAILNYLGTNPGTPTTELVNNIPLPPADVGPAIDILSGSGQIVPGGGGWVVPKPIREL